MTPISTGMCGRRSVDSAVDYFASQVGFGLVCPGCGYQMASVWRPDRNGPTVVECVASKCELAGKHFEVELPRIKLTEVERAIEKR